MEPPGPLSTTPLFAMNLSPPSLTQSSSTPCHAYCPSDRSSLDYPSPGLVEQQYKLSPIYGAEPPCSMPPGLEAGPETSLPPLDAMSQSPDWNTTGPMHPSSSPATMPSIVSAECGTYLGYGSPYGHDMYHAHSPHGTPMDTATPPPSRPVARSPVPSMPRTPLSYPPATSVPGPLKMETSSEYGQTIEVAHYPSPRSVQSVPTPYTADNGGYTSAASGYLSDTSSTGWHKSDYPTAEADHFYGGATGQGPAFMHDAPRAYRVQRPRRAPRRLTTKEEANFQCEVKGCGKLFSRSYNFKAHMETHDEKREYPFPCLLVGCNKKFVRKTDLQRHHSSVHARERSYKCDYCARMFARKDTLRRWAFLLATLPCLGSRPPTSSD